ncbi:MAG: glycosyltransferase [Steroidobacteraceae bacterium]
MHAESTGTQRLRPPGGRASGPVRLVAIVPTLHDDAALAELLSDLARLEAPPEQVIVVDGASSEPPSALCHGENVRWLRSAVGRGVQLSAGVAAAKEALGEGPAAGTDVLWFLHADCRPDPRSAAVIRTVIGRGAAGGYFRFRFGGSGCPLKALLERCIALRCRVGMVYCDQGIFVTRTAYEASPGIDPQPLFEEVPLIRHLKSTRRFVALDLPITVSPRRWERDGFMRRTLHNRLLAVGYLLGMTPTRLARWYRSAG